MRYVKKGLSTYKMTEIYWKRLMYVGCDLDMWEMA